MKTRTTTAKEIEWKCEVTLKTRLAGFGRTMLLLVFVECQSVAVTHWCFAEGRCPTWNKLSAIVQCYDDGLSPEGSQSLQNATVTQIELERINLQQAVLKFFRNSQNVTLVLTGFAFSKRPAASVVSARHASFAVWSLCCVTLGQRRPWIL